MKLLPYSTINLANPVDIYLKDSILKESGKIVHSYSKGNRAVIITDNNVAPLYAKVMLDSIKNEGLDCSVIGIESGESSKNMNTILNLYGEFNEKHITRSDMIIALGGGVVGDITGFAAATYMRGIPYIQCPTTLLAQIDSSIGGKTGIDLPYGKNLAGAFYQPKAIIIDPTLLSTLPVDYYNDGIAEAIKYGFIQDKEIIDILSKDCQEHDCAKIISKCIAIKSTIVEQDEKESGLRMLLNFGHTYGHAIERAMNYKGIKHGEAVAIGMVKAMDIGVDKGITSEDSRRKLHNLLDKFTLPKATDISNDILCDAISSDKKREANMINFVFIQDIGQAIVKKMAIDELRSF